MFGSDNLPNHAKGMKARILDDSTYVRHIRYYLQLYPPQQVGILQSVTIFSKYMHMQDE